jgi:hypothetical protein
MQLVCRHEFIDAQCCGSQGDILMPSSRKKWFRIVYGFPSLVSEILKYMFSLFACDLAGLYWLGLVYKLQFISD